MSNAKITLSSLGLGLLCALAWYAVFALRTYYFHIDRPSHVHGIA
jgi:hypothetical protein